jgi:hypothetical protein
MFQKHGFLTFFFLRYITFDISFSLLDPSSEVLRCPHEVVAKIVASLAPLRLSEDEIEAESHALWPAMAAMKRRDLLYKCARELVTPGESCEIFCLFHLSICIYFLLTQIWLQDHHSISENSPSMNFRA